MTQRTRGIVTVSFFLLASPWLRPDAQAASPAGPAAGAPASAIAPAAREREVRFVAHRVGGFRGEACAVADFDRDGKLDIAAGPFLYLAPDWRAVMIRVIDGSVNVKGDGYYHDFMNAPLDADGDELPDIVTCDWFGMCLEWYRNPGPSGGTWERHLVERSGNHECGELADIDGDGKALEILPHVQPTVWWEVAPGPDGRRAFRKHVVSERPLDFGAGAGDLNGDGRPDLIRPGAWYEAPPDPRAGAWKEHPLAVGHIEEGKSAHTPQILVYDVNADGKNDIVTSSAHEYGIFWYEQLPGDKSPRWKQHLIDRSWSQAHSLALADLDGDGDLDLVTGKRFRAHNGGDPGEDDPLVVSWYELERGPEPRWRRHDISSGEGIGSGLTIPVADLDGDGDLDIVVTGKWGGPVWFENKLR